MQLSIEGGSLDHRVVGDPAANDTIFGELVQGSHTLLRRTLSSAQETLLEHAGYLAIDDMADADEVAMLRRDILGVLEPRGLAVASLRSDFSGVETPPDGPFVPVLQNPQSHAPGVLRTRFYRNALGIARQLLGFDARLARAHVVVKPPGADARTPWHQDEAYGDPAFEHRELSFCLALDDIDETSGCLRFVPGSHHEGVVTHRANADDPRGAVLDCSGSFDVRSASACPLFAGGCTIHTSTTIYGADANATDSPRWIYVLSFGLPPAPIAGARSYAWRRHEAGWQRWLKRVPMIGKREARPRAA